MPLILSLGGALPAGTRFRLWDVLFSCGLPSFISTILAVFALIEGPVLDVNDIQGLRRRRLNQDLNKT